MTWVIQSILNQIQTILKQAVNYSVTGLSRSNLDQWQPERLTS